MNQERQIGIDRKIRVEWLEYTASLVMLGSSKADIVAALQEKLKDVLSGGGKSGRGCREKTITVLSRVWATPPGRLVSLRNAGLGILARTPVDEHLAIHWAAMMATYPFWRSVAEITGRLLGLQGTASASQVLRRVMEIYGERQTASRSCQRVLRSFVDWGVLTDTEVKGVYQQGRRTSITDPELNAWVVEAMLLSGASFGNLSEIRSSPALFPFDISMLKPSDVERNGRLELIQHGLNHELVTLK